MVTATMAPSRTQEVGLLREQSTRMEVMRPTPDEPQPVSNIKLTLYARNAGQEFARYRIHGECTNAWPSPPPVWNRIGNLCPASDEIEQMKLGDVLHIRRDAEEFGFVSAGNNRAIYLADGNTMDVIESLADKTVSQIRREQPAIMSELAKVTEGYC